ncbi:Na+/H+ antiporter [Burkholderia sp. WAC0059]|uniref:Na+/H+ antiporter n=1 Tax=Burkholderia sp. WAC0059 TaxID=2066022 RepID=UPI000C7F1049|nr:Na+/H+ antiporter [Burkholderia sp. WAC0059]PLZ00856.1 Na+/H+ antiporter [Burkholderia sp. WAC0059]
MTHVEFFHYLLLLIAGAAALTWLAERLSLAPAIVLLLGGSAVALTGRPAPGMDPNLVLEAVLPPLLMSSAFYTAWKDFRRELAPILSLALGAVLFTTVAVAAVVHAVEPALGWAPCFALGAIVSPPDAVAAKAMLRRFPLPPRLVTVLEGESLVNDASGLLLYQMAVAAAVAGQLTPGHAAVVFSMLMLVGVAVGALAGYGMVWLIARLREPLFCIVLTFLMAWASYSVAEDLHGSGVLSVVTCGLVLGIRQHEVFDAHVRIKAEATWEAVVFVLDALVFILIGLALNGMVAKMERGGTLLAAGLGVALAATVAAILARLAWVAAAVWLPSKLRSKLRSKPDERAGRSARAWHFGEAVVLGWAGMRGVVSLAAALALPADFPGRDVIVFSTFLVIFATLVIQGSTLAPLIRLLRLRSPQRTTMSELEARSHTFRASLHELEKIARAADGGNDDERDIVERLLGEYRVRVHNNEKAHAEGAEHVERRAKHLRLELDLVSASRQALLLLHQENRIQDTVLHRIEAELDLEELRLHRLLEP